MQDLFIKEENKVENAIFEIKMLADLFANAEKDCVVLKPTTLLTASKMLNNNASLIAEALQIEA